MVRPSVILSVHYRNHFPLSNFKTKHIFGILVERVNHLGRRRHPNFFLLFYRRRRRRKLTPRPGRPRRPKYGALMAPQFFFFRLVSILSPPPKAAVSKMGAAGTSTGTPKGGAGGATSPEGKGNPAESGSSRVCF